MHYVKVVAELCKGAMNMWASVRVDSQRYAPDLLRYARPEITLLGNLPGLGDSCMCFLKVPYNFALLCHRNEDLLPIYLGILG